MSEGHSSSPVERPTWEELVSCQQPASSGQSYKMSHPERESCSPADILMAVKCETQGLNHQDKLPPHSWLTETVRQNKCLDLKKKLKSLWCFIRFRNSKFQAFFSTLFSLSFDIRWKFTCMTQKIFEWLVQGRDWNISVREVGVCMCIYTDTYPEHVYPELCTHIQTIYTHINNIYTHISGTFIYTYPEYIYIYIYAHIIYTHIQNRCTYPEYIQTYPAYLYKHIQNMCTHIQEYEC